MFSHLPGVSVMIAVFVLSLLVAACPAPAYPDTTGLLRRAQELHSNGDLAAARDLYERVIPMLRAEGNRKNLGGALYLVSLAYNDLGEYSKALEAGTESLEIRKSLGDKGGQADSANSIGLALLNLGDYSKALDQFEAALVLYRGVRDLEESITVLNNAANVLLFQARYSEALERYERAMDLIEQSPKEEWNPHQLQITSANMAVLFQKLGRHNLALDLYSRLRATPGVLSPDETGRVLANLGALYRHMGDPVKALETYRQAQDAFKAHRNYDGEIGVLKNIGIAQALDMRDLHEALRNFREALDLARRTSNKRETLQSHLYSGEVYRRLQRPSEAREEFNEALRGARSLGAVEEEWKALYGLGRLAMEQGEDARSLTFFRQAIVLIESVRSRMRVPSLKAEFLADKRAVYDAALEVLLKPEPSGGTPRVQGSVDEIHRLMERGRARDFKDQLFDSLESLRAQADPVDARQLRELRAQMALNRNRQLHAEGDEVRQLQAQYSGMEARYVEIESALAASLSSRDRDPDLTIGEIQSRLPSRTALFEIWMGEESLAALRISRAGAGVARERLTGNPGQTVRACVEHMADPSSGDWNTICAPVADMLQRIVLPQVKDSDGHLIFVLDEKLASLPLEALLLPDGSGFFIDRFSISYLPSASMISNAAGTASMRHRIPWAPTLMAFGDPFFTIVKRQNGIQSAENEQPPLLYSRYEVHSIADEVPGRKRLYLGRDALKKHLFEEDARAFRLLHFSTHARADLENPQGSSILFSSEGPEAAADSLFLGEILNLELSRTELVTLSACETARGKIIEGEGPQDFSRAFLMAGANATVASLWRVADQPTAEFMKQFYYYLSRGSPKAEALRKAKLRFIHSRGLLAHPYYWAAFVLSGDGAAPVTLPLSWGTFLTLLGIILLGCTAILHVLLRRQKS